MLTLTFDTPCGLTESVVDELQIAASQGFPFVRIEVARHGTDAALDVVTVTSRDPDPIRARHALTDALAPVSWWPDAVSIDGQTPIRRARVGNAHLVDPNSPSMRRRD